MQIADLSRDIGWRACFPVHHLVKTGFDKIKQEHVKDMLLLESGSDLLSRAVSSQVPSARRGLTSVFGMGTGGSLLPLPPEISWALSLAVRSTCLHIDACSALSLRRLLCYSRIHIRFAFHASASALRFRFCARFAFHESVYAPRFRSALLLSLCASATTLSRLPTRTPASADFMHPSAYTASAFASTASLPDTYIRRFASARLP